MGLRPNKRGWGLGRGGRIGRVQKGVFKMDNGGLTPIFVTALLKPFSAEKMQSRPLEVS